MRRRLLTFATTTSDNDGFDERGTVSFGVAWKNDFMLTVGVTRQRERLPTPFSIYRDNLITAGYYQRWEGRLSMESDPTRTFSGTAEVRIGGLYGGRHRFADVETHMAPESLHGARPGAGDRPRQPSRPQSFRATVARLRLGLTSARRLAIRCPRPDESERRGEASACVPAMTSARAPESYWPGTRSNCGCRREPPSTDPVRHRDPERSAARSRSPTWLLL